MYKLLYFSIRFYNCGTAVSVFWDSPKSKCIFSIRPYLCIVDIMQSVSILTVATI